MNSSLRSLDFKDLGPVLTPALPYAQGVTKALGILKFRETYQGEQKLSLRKVSNYLKLEKDIPALVFQYFIMFGSEGRELLMNYLVKDCLMEKAKVESEVFLIAEKLSSYYAA